MFFLTLAALYGLGMVLASLFLMWGREAWHLTQLMTEPVYFVSGPQLPGRPPGPARRARARDDPARGGARRDAPAGVRRDRPAAAGTFLSPEAEALILVVMTVVFIGLARWMLRTLERRARREGRLTVRWR